MAAPAPPPPFSPEVEAASPCVEPNRVLFYERLGRYFDWVKPEKAKVGTCTRCGAEGVAIVDKDGKGKGPCLAQDAMTSKRYGPADGEPMAYGVKLRINEKRNRGDFAIAGDKSFCLIGPERTVYVGSVAPSRPLPEWLEVHAEFKGPRFTDLMRRAIEKPAYPYLLANFTQKGDIPFELTLDDTFIVVNGTGTPQRLDRERLVTAIELIREFGAKAVDEAVEMKDLVARGLPGGQKAFTALREKHPALAARLADVPGRKEPERAFANAFVKAETQPAATAGTSNETPATGEGEHACA